MPTTLKCLNKWRRPGSNRQPPPCKGGALPVELRPRMGSLLDRICERWTAKIAEQCCQSRKGVMIKSKRSQREQNGRTGTRTWDLSFIRAAL
jgi:hypothetical protein